MKINIAVENIRCGGCANTITKKLMAIDGIEQVDVEIDEQVVSVEATDTSFRPVLVKTLLALGYPETGSVEGLEALKGKAKSIVSCAVGKVS